MLRGHNDFFLHRELREEEGGAADDVSSCFSQSSLEITFILLVVVLQSGHWRLYDYLLYKNERVRVYVCVCEWERETEGDRRVSVVAL